MLAAKNGHKDVVLILSSQKEPNLNLVDNVSIHVHMLYDKNCITEDVSPFP